MTRVIEREEWAVDPALWKGEIPGESSGAGVSIIFNYQKEAGGGPRLHRHPYAETFIIRQGTAIFTVGEETIRANAGQIVVVPAGVPHKFTNEGPGPMESIDIHASPTFVTEWLE
jgi:mannose-6-phosphate isomerase-like protein (cupin superfamily)